MKVRFKIFRVYNGYFIYGYLFIWRWKGLLDNFGL